MVFAFQMDRVGKVGKVFRGFATLTVSLSEGFVIRRRNGTPLFYALAERQDADLMENTLAHAVELNATPAATKEEYAVMAHHHEGHSHKHGAKCGHQGVKHNGHIDYLHDGHLHHVGKDGVEEHALEVNAANPASCTPQHSCGKHEKGHQHGPGCGHTAVPHGDHVDYLVDGHLHHPHGDHCDDHGKIELA
jgi:hypothetical protein